MNSVWLTASAELLELDAGLVWVVDPAVALCGNAVKG
jgi:hypothetical protein